MAEMYRYKGGESEHHDPVRLYKTSDIQNYIQGNVNTVLSLLRKKDKAYANMHDINVKVVSWQASPNCIPFIVLLPPAVLKNVNESKNNDSNIPSIFYNLDEEDHQIMIDELEAMFKIYAYTEEDIRALKKSEKLLNELKLSRKNAMILANMARPRFRKFRSGNSDDDNSDAYVMFIIDPIRVFHDMMVDTSNLGEQFSVDITSVDKIRNGEYRFRVKRSRNRGKKKNKNGMNMYNEILAALRNNG